MSLIVHNHTFLTKNLTFTPNLSEANLVNIEQVYQSDNESLFRIRIGDKYISCDNGQIFLSDKKDDNSLIIQDSFKQMKTIYGLLDVCNSKLFFNRFQYNSRCNSMYNNSPNFEIISGIIPELYKNGIVILNSSYNLDRAAQLIKSRPEYRISNLFQLDYDYFMEILNDPFLHYILKQVYPQGYHCTTFSSNTLYKNVDGRGWHCDYPYHDIQAPYPAETLGIQVLWTLDDFTYENGATFYIPGSHSKKYFPNNAEVEAEDKKHNIYCLKVPRGKMVIFLGKLWHTQGINITDNSRSSLLANFSPLSVKPKDNMAAQVKEDRITDGMFIF